MAGEKNFENRIKDFLKSKGIYYFKMLGCSATRAGVPDLICCINGKFVAIEVKAANGRPTPLQQMNIAEINRNKGVAIIVYPKDFENLKGLIEGIIDECN